MPGTIQGIVDASVGKNRQNPCPHGPCNLMGEDEQTKIICTLEGDKWHIEK